jgi:hypothetical protein
VPVVDGDGGQRADPLAQVRLQQRPADTQAVEARFGAGEPVAAVDPDEVAQHVDRDGAPCGQVGDAAGEEFLDHPAAAGEQAVQVLVLRDALAVGGGGRQRVPVEESDRLE